MRLLVGWLIGRDSSSLPSQNDKSGLPVILIEAKNLSKGQKCLKGKKRVKKLVVTGNRFFVVPPQNDM
ncbi:MAG: hypothetical protein JG782_857 [Anaerophaga sp.]|nr:hypothetical protein [Anaerophaga sp.]